MKQNLLTALSVNGLVRRAMSLLLAAPILVSAGCATIANGGRQKIEVVTDPPGATASAGEQRVTTPGVLRLPRRNRETTILVDKPGYDTCRVSLKRKQGGWTFLNFLGIPAGAAAGGSIGMVSTAGWAAFAAGTVGLYTGAILVPAAAFAIDYATGAAYRLEPGRVEVELTAAQTAAGGPTDATGFIGPQTPPPSCTGLLAQKAPSEPGWSRPESKPADADGLR